MKFAVIAATTLFQSCLIIHTNGYRTSLDYDDFSEQHPRIVVRRDVGSDGMNGETGSGQLQLDSVMEFLESSMAQQRSLFQHMIDVFANSVLNTTNEQIRILDENMKQNSEILVGNRLVLNEQLGLTNVYLEMIAKAITGTLTTQVTPTTTQSTQTTQTIQSTTLPTPPLTQTPTQTSTTTENTEINYKLIDDRGAIIVGPEMNEMCIWRRGSISQSIYSVSVRPCENHNKAKWRFSAQTGKIEGRNCYLMFREIGGVFQLACGKTETAGDVFAYHGSTGDLIPMSLATTGRCLEWEGVNGGRVLDSKDCDDGVKAFGIEV